MTGVTGSSENTDNTGIIEGFHARGAYVAFWADFLQDRANFWHIDFF